MLGIDSLLTAHGDCFLTHAKLFLVLRFTLISAALGIDCIGSNILFHSNQKL